MSIDPGFQANVKQFLSSEETLYRNVKVAEDYFKAKQNNKYVLFSRDEQGLHVHTYSWKFVAALISFFSDDYYSEEMYGGSKAVKNDLRDIISASLKYAQITQLQLPQLPSAQERGRRPLAEQEVLLDIESSQYRLQESLITIQSIFKDINFGSVGQQQPSQPKPPEVDIKEREALPTEPEDDFDRLFKAAEAKHKASQIMPEEPSAPKDLNLPVATPMPEEHSAQEDFERPVIAQPIAEEESISKSAEMDFLTPTDIPDRLLDEDEAREMAKQEALKRQKSALSDQKTAATKQLVAQIESIRKLNVYASELEKMEKTLAEVLRNPLLRGVSDAMTLWMQKIDLLRGQIEGLKKNPHDEQLQRGISASIEEIQKSSNDWRANYFPSKLREFESLKLSTQNVSERVREFDAEKEKLAKEHAKDWLNGLEIAYQGMARIGNVQQMKSKSGLEQQAFLYQELKAMLSARPGEDVEQERLNAFVNTLPAALRESVQELLTIRETEEGPVSLSTSLSVKNRIAKMWKLSNEQLTEKLRNVESQKTQAIEEAQKDEAELAMKERGDWVNVWSQLTGAVDDLHINIEQLKSYPQAMERAFQLKDEIERLKKEETNLI